MGSGFWGGGFGEQVLGRGVVLGSWFWSGEWILGWGRDFREQVLGRGASSGVESGFGAGRRIWGAGFGAGSGF